MVSRSTDNGRFARTATEMERYLANVDSSGGPDACWLWTGGQFDSGYGRFSLADAKRSSVRSHRWGYGQLVGPIPSGEIVRHTCDIPLCHNPKHWILGTNAMNSADMVERDRQAKGEANGQAVLTESLVKEIRLLAERVPAGRGRKPPGSPTYAGIAEIYGISAVLVGQIRRRQAWKHVL